MVAEGAEERTVQTELGFSPFLARLEPRPVAGLSFPEPGERMILRLLFFLFTLHSSLFTLGCGDKTKCEGKAGGLSALEVINPTDCDLNILVDQGRLVFVPAKTSACQANLGDAPLTGDHTVQAVKNKTGEVCETRSVDFGSAPSDPDAPGRLVTYQPSLISCVCELPK